MPQVIQFFTRQAISSAAAGVELHSEVYDVSNYSQIVAQLRIYSYQGSNPISAALQDCMDPAFAPDALGQTVWRNVASTSLAATGSASFSGSGLLRFARMVLTYSNTITAAILAVEGVAHEGV